MQDLLAEVLEEQKPYLEKYDNHNVRSKNVKFFPFEKEKEENLINTVNEISKETSKNKKLEKINLTPKEEIKESVAPNKESEVSKVIEQASNSRHFDLKTFARLSRDRFAKDNTLREKEKALLDEKRKDTAARKKIITQTYLYIFRNFLNYSLVFDEFPEIIKNFPKFVSSIPKVTASPMKIRNIKEFVYKLRTVSLIQKINILAYQLGQYNFSLIVNEIYDVSVLTEYTPEDLAVVVFDKYKGSDLDYEALLSLYDVVDADMNGKIIFDEKEKKTNEVRKETVKVEDKREKRRSALGFGSFSLKNKK